MLSFLKSHPLRVTLYTTPSADLNDDNGLMLPAVADTRYHPYMTILNLHHATHPTLSNTPPPPRLYFMSLHLLNCILAPALKLHNILCEKIKSSQIRQTFEVLEIRYLQRKIVHLNFLLDCKI